MRWDTLIRTNDGMNSQAKDHTMRLGVPLLDVIKQKRIFVLLSLNCPEESLVSKRILFPTSGSSIVLSYLEIAS